ncbi:MAG: PqqD family protein [Prevotellaceae bacterium]|nr:PqqD family protein [Prevotellaceae bacterium]
MKIKEGFNLRSIINERFIISDGMKNIDFNKIIRLNETSAYLCENIMGKEFTIDDMVKLLTDEYEVDEATAKSDCESLIQQWTEIGIIE